MSGADQGTLTFLFTDVEGSTAFRTQVGDAAANRVLQAHDRSVVELVARYDGSHVKSLGDGCLAVFASSRKAVECAVAVQRAAESSPLRVRIRINAGEVERSGDDVLGTAVHAAARIAAKAQGGEILVSDLVRQLTGSIAELEFRDRGRFRLRGFPDRWRLYEIVWQKDQGPGPAGGQHAPLVGRTAELARIHRVLDSLPGGRGAAVLLRGEAGIGKTRLATEALAHASSRGWRTLTGRASPLEGGLGLGPIIEAFGGLLRSLDRGSVHDLVGDLPHLAHLFEGLGVSPPAPLSDPALERTLLFESVARLLERVAAEGPVVLLIDDIQWADPATLELVHHLARAIERQAVALLVTWRSSELAPNDRLRRLLVSLRRLPAIEEIDVGRLDSEAVTALAAERLGGRLPPGLREVLLRAGGTPLFIDGFLHVLIDSGRLSRSGEGWALTDGEVKVPPAVRDVVLERLDGLEPGCRRVVDLVALSAGGVAHEVLADASGMDPDELGDAVEHLESAGALVEEEDGPDLVYRLAHPLYHEVAAGELPSIARRRGHAVLAERAWALFFKCGFNAQLPDGRIRL